jgi:predicted nucleotidyltransferase
MFFNQFLDNIAAMDKDEVIAVLRAHKSELHRLGVKHAALFGSVARGEADEKSDIDIAIEIDPNANEKMSIFDYVGITLFISDLFPAKVDVVNRRSLKPYVKEAVEADLVNAF